METGVANGVSVIVCCYNSAARLPQTLHHLSVQLIPDAGFEWELIIVDNASTDLTGSVAEAALTGFNANAMRTGRVIQEPVAGQMHARKTGVRAAKFECIIFCDDDNWLHSAYIHTAYQTMLERSDAGAAGGQNVPVTNAAAYPVWFEEFKNKYAIGIPAPESGDVSHRGFILGAGLVTRKSLFLEMFNDRYPSLLNGRNGENMSTGDDFEYCKRLLLRGYKLYYNASLHLQHFIPAERLTIEYRERLMEGISDAGKILHEYDLALTYYRRNKHKNKLRLLLLTPFRITLARFGLTKRALADEQLTLFYLRRYGDRNQPVRTQIRRFLYNR
jgi:glycosyltransferase involved in cell wall biosynthesis